MFWLYTKIWLVQYLLIWIVMERHGKWTYKVLENAHKVVMESRGKPLSSCPVCTLLLGRCLFIILWCIFIWPFWSLCTVTVETGLRQRITELQRYRQAGLRWLRSAKLYDKMAARQEVSRPHLLDDVLHYIQVSYLLCLLSYCDYMKMI